jgi:hypothetical protein
MSSEPPPRTSPEAVASLVLGLLSPVLSLLGAVPAIFLGVRAVRAINLADGRLRGTRLAVAGMALGVLVTMATVVGVGAFIVLRMNRPAGGLACVDNLRAIGLAAHVYADTHGQVFPPGTAPTPGLAPGRRLSWLALLLPYMEAKTHGARTWQSLADKLDRDKAWDVGPNAATAGIRVRRFLCPMAHLAGETVPAPTSYPGLAGVDPDAALLAKTDPRAGFFGYDRTITADDVRRGLNYTMIVAETGSNPGPWLAGGPATDRGLDPDVTTYIGAGRPFGGLHPAGANVLWGGGAVTVVAPPVSAHQFRASSLLSAAAGGE